MEHEGFLTIAVTGGRHLAMVEIGHGEWEYDQALVEQALGNLEALWALAGGTKKEPIPFMLNGACPTGLDALAKEWAESRGYHFKLFTPNWPQNGRAAGPLRNQEMVDEADALIAFPGGRGTADCVRRAERKGIPIYRAVL